LQHQTLNLGILAHVDAGKTTLTEQLLYSAGIIDEIGSVDAGTTQTDSLALERQRGITIKSAVVSFAIDDVTVNLIDTPGHPDFITEVERALSVLDGAVLVISAVEGVQPQTRILMRALQRLRIPLLIFVNKIDRMGADAGRVLHAISERLSTATIPMGSVDRLGTRGAQVTAYTAHTPAFCSHAVEVLAERDDALLAAYVDDAAQLASGRLRKALATQTQQAFVYPVFFGSAITGAGVPALMKGIAELLPSSTSDSEGHVSATIFKIERGTSAEKIAYVRMFSGTIRVRDQLRFGQGQVGKATAIAVFERGLAVQRLSVSAGAVAKLWGLTEVRIGDRIGENEEGGILHRFPPPTLEAVVVPASSADSARLRAALTQLAEQDPLINVRQDETSRGVSISLYGEVQKDVIQETLASEFGINVTFRETTPIHIERPIRIGEAVEVLHAESNPFLATIGLRIEPAPVDCGIDFQLAVDHSAVPLYIYKTIESFREHMAGYVSEALQEGLFGWRVSNCIVTMIECVYSIPDGPPSRRGPPSTAADFRKLTPLVLRQALVEARVVVCEPTIRVSVEVPAATNGAVMSALARLGAAGQTASIRGQLATIEAVLRVAQTQELRRQLASLTGGEGIVESSFAGYQPVHGRQPSLPIMTKG
jgi:ribosomal protection tetracycline resistance protein